MDVAALPVADRISGLVVDLAGRPVAGARVAREPDWILEERVRSGKPREELETRTDAEGRFEFPVSRVGVVEFEAPRHPLYFGRYGSTSFEESEPIVIEMHRRVPITLEVSVRNATTGELVPRAYVQVYNLLDLREDKSVHMTPDPTYTRHEVWDDPGSKIRGAVIEGGHRREEVLVLEDEPLRFRVHVPGKTWRGADDPGYRTVHPRAGDVLHEVFEFTLDGPESLSTNPIVGRVLDATTGEPIHGAEVRAHAEHSRQVATDATGHFVVEPGAGAGGKLVCEAPGYDRFVGRWTRGREATLELTRQGTLTVRVVDGLGLPLPEVPYLFAGGPDDDQRRGRADGEGRIALGGLYSGRYRLHLLRRAGDADEQALESYRFRVRAGEDREEVCSVEPPDRVHVRGTVFGGADCTPLPVFLPLFENAGWVAAEASGPRGYDAGGMERGAYAVLFVPRDDDVDADPCPTGYLPRVEIDGVAFQALDLTLPQGRVSGRLVGEALEGLDVVCVPAGLPELFTDLVASEKWNRVLGSAVRADGSFTIEHVPDGEFELELRARSRVRAARTITVSGGGANLDAWVVE